ncbi:hypothetical protein [Vibrio lentus]|uniref:hypothetical protein n=1 Tax=Vibrio lentus TaxID=136468 RepID=UPI0010BD88FD|nr:hypothetical protein [Vibrio lentus]TKG17755.1 hypothetical protein FCW05_12680 [Vibrio lentus]
MTPLLELMRSTPKELGINPRQKSLLITISSHYKMYNGLIQARLPIDYLSRLVGYSESWVIKNIKELAGKYFACEVDGKDYTFYWLTVSGLKPLTYHFEREVMDNERAF